MFFFSVRFGVVRQLWQRVAKQQQQHHDDRTDGRHQHVARMGDNKIINVSAYRPRMLRGLNAA